MNVIETMTSSRSIRKYTDSEGTNMDESTKEKLLSELVGLLLEERGKKAIVPPGRLWETFRALVNTRPPWPAGERMLRLQDELLAEMLREKGIHGIDEAEVSPFNHALRLWRGDITTLKVDAIVNAANSQMLGCWVPGHHCIDNAIHTFAGIQLRLECNEIMQGQGHEEPTGCAKITSAYNLPCKHVIHTVGPIADGCPSSLHGKQLASCYESCLDLAEKQGVTSLAFCCISTGIFGFPQKEAAEIAVRTVSRWLGRHPESGLSVVFNVFLESDEAIYRELLGMPKDGRPANP